MPEAAYVKRVIVDIDGTLTVETEGFGDDVYRERTPRPVMIKYIRDIHESGMHVCLYTSRFACDEEVTKEWLEKHGVPYDELVFDKPQYDLWIDDKSVKPELVEMSFNVAQTMIKPKGE